MSIRFGKEQAQELLDAVIYNSKYRGDGSDKVTKKTLKWYIDCVKSELNLKG
jgi:hypothetical protein